MLFKLLKTIDRQRFEPVVISLTSIGEIGLKIRSCGINVSSLEINRKNPNIFKIFKLWFEIRKMRPAIIQTWMYHSDLLGGIVSYSAGYKRIVWGLRHSDPIDSCDKKSTQYVIKLCALFSRIVPISIVSCSEKAKLSHSKKGYPKSKIRVIPNGFDIDDFKPNPEARRKVREQYKIPNDAQIVGMVGRYHLVKNHQGFLDAAKIVCKILPKCQFLFVGEGVDCNNTGLVEMIERRALSSNVHLCGRSDDISSIMAGFDVMASASKAEAFPNVLAEAMACGVPCVVTDVGESADIVGDCGRVVPKDDMTALANNIIEILTLGSDNLKIVKENARKRIITKYNINRVVTKYQRHYLAIYRALRE